MEGGGSLRFIVTHTVPFPLLRSYILFSSFKNGSVCNCTILYNFPIHLISLRAEAEFDLLKSVDSLL